MTCSSAWARCDPRRVPRPRRSPRPGSGSRRRSGTGPGAARLGRGAARPRSSAFGADAYATLELKAAALLHSVARHHALVDGNKRLAWLATVVFLDLNGRAPALSHDAAFELVMGTAEGTWDAEQIADRLPLAK